MATWAILLGFVLCVVFEDVAGKRAVCGKGNRLCKDLAFAGARVGSSYMQIQQREKGDPAALATTARLHLAHQEHAGRAVQNDTGCACMSPRLLALVDGTEAAGSQLSCEKFCINNDCDCLIPWVDRCKVSSCASCAECSGGTSPTPSPTECKACTKDSPVVGFTPTCTARCEVGYECNENVGRCQVTGASAPPANCIGACRGGFFCCAALAGSCIPNGSDCPCPTCSDKVDAAATCTGKFTLANAAEPDNKNHCCPIRCG